MALIEDLLEKIPERFHELAKAHLPILVNMADELILEWIDLILAGDYQKAYEITNNKMTAEERIAEQRRLNELYELYNKETAEIKFALFEFFQQLLLALIAGKIKN